MAHQSADVGNGKAEVKWNGKLGGEKDESPENKAAANEQLHEGEGRGGGPPQGLGQHMVAEYRIGELLWTFEFGEARRYEKARLEPASAEAWATGRTETSIPLAASPS